MPLVLRLAKPLHAIKEKGSAMSKDGRFLEATTQPDVGYRRCQGAQIPGDF